MSSNWYSYSLQSGISSMLFVRSQVLDENRHVHAFAEGSLEGWSVISAGFSSGFLESLFQHATNSSNKVFADIAETAFEKALEQFNVGYPPWSSMQYVAVYVDDRELRFSWIGDMYLVASNMSRTWLANRPHLLKGVGPDGREQRAVLKVLRQNPKKPEESQPEVGESEELDHPTILFLGNRNLQSVLQRPEIHQYLLTSTDEQEFQRRCERIERVLADDGVRGLFVHL